MSKATDTVISYRGTKLVRREKTGPKGGRVRIYQAQCASRDWGYWYDTAAQAAAESNETDKVCR